MSPALVIAPGAAWNTLAGHPADVGLGLLVILALVLAMTRIRSRRPGAAGALGRIAERVQTELPKGGITWTKLLMAVASAALQRPRKRRRRRANDAPAPPAPTDTDTTVAPKSIDQ